MTEITANGVAMPSPTQIKISDEIIWSSNTGRAADGSMVGDAIAEKATVAITWEMLTEAERSSIKNAMVIGFFPITVLGIPIISYRGNIQSDLLGVIDGATYYRTVTVTVIQQ